MMTLKEKSEENWKAGIDMYCKHKYNIAANRLYYALFQAAKGYALEQGKMKDEDKNAHFEVHRRISTFVTIKNSTRLYGQMKKFREIADYRPFSVCPNKFSQAFIADVEKMYKELISIISGG